MQSQMDNTLPTAGALYTRILYPGLMRVAPHSAYLITVGDRLASVLINRHIRAVDVLDLQNQITITKTQQGTMFDLRTDIKGISQDAQTGMIRDTSNDSSDVLVVIPGSGVNRRWRGDAQRSKATTVTIGTA